MNQYDPRFDLKINVGHFDLYFMVQWFCLVFWKLFWCMNIIIRDYQSVWPDVDLKINVGHCDLYFMVHWFCIIYWRLVDLWTSYFGLNLNMVKIIGWMNIMVGIIDQCDTKIDLIKYMWDSDLHFMVHWFCFISWRLFDGKMLYLG